MAGVTPRLFCLYALMRKQFYELALPSQGVYCAASILDERVKHKFAYSIDELETILEQLAASDANVYVALSSFKNESRTAKNASHCRSFFIDLDVNHGKVCYDSKEDALEALEMFLEETELPPPVRMDSGGGVQAYWLFADDVPIEEWKIYAAKFKQFCSDKGLLIDPAVTADAARIMRCPGTINRRVGLPAHLLDTEFNQYDFEMFKEFLGVEATDTKADEPVQRIVDDETRLIAKYDNFEDSFALIEKKSLAGEGCNQIKYAIENRETLSYGLWMATLSIAERCVDRDYGIQRVSEGHPDYSFEDASFKASETGKVSGPHKCGTFEEHNPGGCDGCPFKNKFSTPLMLGKQLRKVEEPETPLPPLEDTVWGESPTQDLLVFPEYLLPYSRGANGGIYYTPPPSADKKGIVTQDPPYELLTKAVYPYKRMFSVQDKECFMIRVIMPKDVPREFMLPAKDIYSQENLIKAIAGNGVNFDLDKIKLVMKYFSRWSEYFSNTEAAEQMRMQMGWTKEKDAFVVGNNEVTKHGILKAASSPLVRGVASHLKAVGDYNVWKKSIKAFNEPGFEMHAFGMLTGFGSPLMSFTSVAGASLCFVSADSGTGKTGSLYAAISIWGHPKDLSLVDQGATSNGYIGRYLNLKNIIFGIDEASNAKAEDLAKLIHAVSHGKAKVRMQSSQNAEREHEESASLITFFTSNQSIYDKLQTLKASPDGEMARLIEFNINKPPQLTNDMGIEVFDKFKYNYGYAGLEFMQHYFKVGEPYVKTVVDRWHKRFAESIGGDETGYRFYQNLVAAVFAGGELAIEAGIIDLDLNRIYDAVIMEIIQLRDGTVKINTTDYKALITEFLYQNWSGMLVLSEPNKVVQEPMAGRPLIARCEKHTNMQYISKTEFKKYLAHKQVSTREFEKALEKDGIMTEIKKHRLSTGWGNGFHAHPIAVYAFRNELPEDMMQKSQ